ncbi:MAG TPA: tetratricopeptide repeat protein [Candidatus Cloacimonadota bacterium]|mgnify:CR=1 FL=1|nr:tetratricopeptide repeat protein [Candidatus Cloacimonadota bacterium]
MKRIIILLAVAVLVLGGCASNRAMRNQQQKTQALDARQSKQETDLEMLRKEYLQIKERLDELTLGFDEHEQVILAIEPMQYELEANAEDMAFMQDQVATLVDRVADVINDQNLATQRQADQAAEIARLREQAEQNLTELIDQQIADLREELKQIESDADFILDAITDNIAEIKRESAVSSEYALLEGENGLNALKADLDGLREIVVDLYSEFAASGMVASEEMEQRLGEESGKRVQMMDDILKRIATVEGELRGTMGHRTAAVDEDLQEIRADVDQLEQEVSTLREEQLSSIGNIKTDVATLRQKVENVSNNVGEISSDLEAVIQVERAKKEKIRLAEIKAKYDAALKAYSRFKHEDSILKFEEFISLYPDEELTPNAYYWLAENYYAGKKWSTAADIFQDVIDKFPEHPKARDAYLKLGMTYYNMEMKQQAREVFQLIKDMFPKYSRMDLVNRYLQLTANL